MLSVLDCFPFSFASSKCFEIFSVATALIAIFVRGSGEPEFLYLSVIADICTLL